MSVFNAGNVTSEVFSNETVTPDDLHMFLNNKLSQEDELE